MSTKKGRAAESKAANKLAKQGFTIKNLNWRTRFCEIDIVAVRSGKFYFIEVKYRGSLHQGGGLEYVNSSKLAQMNFAANTYMFEYQLDCEFQLAAIEVVGKNFVVSELVYI